MAAKRKSPVRTAGKSKSKGAPKAEKAAKKILAAVVGSNVSDEQVDKFWRKLCQHRRNITKLNEPVKTERAELSALKKEMKALGIATKGFDLAYELSEEGESGAATFAWYLRIAKRHDLPRGGVDPRQGDLLAETKKDAQKPVPLVDADKLPGGAKANGAGAHGQSRAEQLADLEENGFHQGVAAKPGGLKIPDALKNDPGAVAALKSGYERGQKKNAEAIKAPNEGAVSRGALAH